MIILISSTRSPHIQSDRFLTDTPKLLIIQSQLSQVCWISWNYLSKCLQKDTTCLILLAWSAQNLFILPPALNITMGDGFSVRFNCIQYTAHCSNTLRPSLPMHICITWPQWVNLNEIWIEIQIFSSRRWAKNFIKKRQTFCSGLNHVFRFINAIFTSCTWYLSNKWLP